MVTLVRGVALLGFNEFASSLGLNPQHILSEVGLPSDATSDLISGTQFIALLELCAERSGDALFGLRFGMSQGPKALGDLIYADQTTATVGDVLSALVQNFPTHTTGADIYLERQGTTARFLYDVTEMEAFSVRQTVELAMGLTAQLIQYMLGHPWKPTALFLRHQAGDKPSSYRRLLGITPHFGSPINAWIFDTSILASPLKLDDEIAKNTLNAHSTGLNSLTLETLQTHIQKLLRRKLPNGPIKIEQIAKQLNISPRSLQRHLKSKGTSFQTLLDSTRQSAAARYICDSSLSLTQLSEILGYADLSAFSRAFTRWNGVSPQQWKKMHKPKTIKHFPAETK